MGKTKSKKRNKGKLPCPTGLISTSEIEQDSLESEDFGDLTLGDTNNTAVHSALEKLQSALIEDKECGAFSVALLAEQKDALAELLTLDIVKVAGPLLLDKSPIVRHSVAGALRNISACGGHAASQIMIEQDVLTPLVTLLKRDYQDWTPVKAVDNKIDSLTETYIEAIHLLWNLCESSSTAVSIFNREDLLPMLLNCLNPDVFNFPVVLVVAQCLHAVTEDNKDLLYVFNSQPVLVEQIKVLLSLTGDDPRHHLIRTVACGVLLNLQSVCPVDLRAILTVLSNTLSLDALPSFDNLHEKLSAKKSRRRRKNTPREESVEAENQQLSELVKEISDSLLAKQLALEMITNICFSDEGDNWEEMSSSGDSCDDMFSMNVDEEESVSASKFVPNPLDISCEVHEPLVSLQIVEKVGMHLFLSESLVEKLNFKEIGRVILKKIGTVQCRALHCLNNLASGLGVDDFGGTKELYSVWLQIAQMVFKQAASDTEVELKKELLEAGSSALRAIVEKLAEFKAWHHFQGTTPKDIEMLFEIERMASQPPLADPSIRVNVIRVVSALGTLFASSNQGNMPTVEIQQLVKSISLFLLEVGSKESEVWVIAEALDAIMDVFAEDPLDPLAREIGLTEKLLIILPSLKGKISQQKRSLGIHYSVVMTVKDNLTRFIKYKSDMVTQKKSIISPQLPR